MEAQGKPSDVINRYIGLVLEKQRSITFTESGTEKLEGLLRDALALKPAEAK